MELTPEQVVALWFHYEEVAMHFNELILQYRLHLMSGAGVVGTLASYLIGTKVPDVERRHRARFLVSLILLVLLSAAALLDLGYYNRLLLGAVEALTEFEAAHAPINLSTKIEERVPSLYTIYAVYALILVPLAIFTWIAWREHRKEAKAQTKPPVSEQQKAGA